MRSAWFSLSVLIVAVLWELLSFELPREPLSEAWKQRLAGHILLVAVVGLSSFSGALLGFYFFPEGHSIGAWRVVALGFTFVIVIFFAVVPLLSVGGVVATFVGLLLIAALLVQSGGRWLAQNGT